MAELVVVTVRSINKHPVDLALPYDLPCHIILDAVATVLKLPQQKYLFLWKQGRRIKTISPQETLGEAGISYGDFLEIIPQSASVSVVHQDNLPGAMLVAANGQSFPVVGSSFRIGRRTPVSAVDLDLSDLDDARVTSKKHAVLEMKKGRYYLRDENSTNGTRINNQELQPGETREIHNQDIIEFGGPKGVSLTFITQS